MADKVIQHQIETIAKYCINCPDDKPLCNEIECRAIGNMLKGFVIEKDILN